MTSLPHELVDMLAAAAWQKYEEAKAHGERVGPRVSITEQRVLRTRIDNWETLAHHLQQARDGNASVLFTATAAFNPEIVGVGRDGAFVVSLGAADSALLVARELLDSLNRHQKAHLEDSSIEGDECLHVRVEHLRDLKAAVQRA